MLNWGHTDGHWLDVNAGFALPFIVENDDTAESATLSVAVNGYRKVLVIPARFQDEVTITTDHLFRWSISLVSSIPGSAKR